MAHIVLLGDSVFDNKRYVGGEFDVTEHLREMIPQDWQASLKAVDGSVIENVSRQVKEIPNGATHLIVSGGGNDALMNADVLQMNANSAAEVLSVLANRAKNFELNYARMLETVLGQNLPTAVCTIYYPNFPNDALQKIAVAALSVFNDVIFRQAILAGVPVLDLRLICNEKSNYANEIEPSSEGGKKIAARILGLIETHDFSHQRTQIFA
ncbi:MAG: SGNH/GDSL hydrolase family protein [Acidobacteria bacterium]|nr:SGNH/GDSL hydrolase family protein [Acidobacteriota bacterium]MCA1638623.1 SGNH/GDSL hydrolase family protein [Acidobacteriota bacterium]